MNRYVSVALIVVASAFAACDKTTSPRGGIDASFDLRSINGTSLPYTKTLGTATLRITSDVLTLHGDGGYEESTTYSIPSGQSTQVSTTVERGTYSASGNTITFTSKMNGSRYSGSVNGTTLTESASGGTMIYERR